MDSITHIIFGKPFGFLEHDRDMMNFVHVMESRLPIILHFGVFTKVNDLLKLLGKFEWFRRTVLTQRSQSKGLGRAMAEHIDDRLAKSEELGHDMLASFLRHGLDPVEAEEEISIALVAGSDTTSTGIHATLLSIICSPPIYNKLLREIDNAIATGRVSSPIQDTEARRLPYLQACIYEGLHCFPPLTKLREPVVPPEGDMINRYKVPGGTFVGFNVWGSQRNHVYGEDPDIFQPERWIEASGERAWAMMKVWELIFSYGSTNCLGQNVAMMTYNKTFVELFRRFDIAVTNPRRPMLGFNYGIFFQRDFNVRVTAREFSSRNM